MSDWETVTILRKKPPKASAMKSEQAINAARRQGVAVDTQSKWGAATNKQHVTTKNTAKLDRETEELKHDKVPLDLGRLIQQGRQARGWSQKELATKVNEKPQVINDYEAGRGIPNQVVIGKIEKAIGKWIPVQDDHRTGKTGVKLRGKERGKPALPPGTKQ
ncbi:endothelial differentiation-related factor 1 homolog isoform X2 [Zootermopsis nevadensis]|uniref:Endothelial differentiation-related factor 1-like protein n=1 Tax=Zootermopsis nevadensis TaxID=136037 RepID=A0A067QU11_ZOONE|nr:endothelial differentiation-related factor 1 homolog isoform X2 [Zootermopsis nevadensis]KDR12453.1 Endothelial differentiation-related factor 1-like protein [Zootermopsis nevadensis]